MEVSWVENEQENVCNRLSECVFLSLSFVWCTFWPVSLLSGKFGLFFGPFVGSPGIHTYFHSVIQFLELILPFSSLAVALNIIQFIVCSTSTSTPHCLFSFLCYLTTGVKFVCSRWCVVESSGPDNVTHDRCLEMCPQWTREHLARLAHATNVNKVCKNILHIRLGHGWKQVENAVKALVHPSTRITTGIR